MIPTPTSAQKTRTLLPSRPIRPK